VIFIATAIRGAFIVRPEAVDDERGFFARTWCQREFAAQGLNPRLVQCSISFTTTKGTVRGMHYQIPPHEEAKLVRCTQGAIYDVLVDLRSNSPSFRQWMATELSASDRQMLYIPEGVAHGFQTLVDSAEVLYQMSAFYHPEFARGVRYDDPAIGVSWPLPVTKVSRKDVSWPLLEPAPLR
jgi:dTDP-4-dehydrorhamnose 3,5-epimerase